MRYQSKIPDPATLSVDHQSNKIGAIRLLLAFLVLVSHSPEMVDHNRSREILTRLFGTLSFGELAVDGFFLVSGYLIAQSAVRSTSASVFLSKRLLRIVPGFAVAYLFTLLVVGPMAGGSLTQLNWAEAVLRMVLLMEPKLDGAFAGAPYVGLNSAMWTIAYEFRCYLIALLLGICGLLRKPRVFIAIVGIAVVCLLTRLHIPLPPNVELVTGIVADDVRLGATFLIGSGFYILRDWVPAYTAKRALIAACLAALCLFSWRLSEAGLVVFGGYALFWFAFASKPNMLNAVGRSTDISYGLYLYAWPIQNLLIWTTPGISPIWVLLISTPVATVLGWLSWTLIEAPALRFKPGAHRGVN